MDRGKVKRRPRLKTEGSNTEGKVSNKKPKKVEGVSKPKKDVREQKPINKGAKVSQPKPTKKVPVKKQVNTQQDKANKEDDINVKVKDEVAGGKKLFNVQWPGMMRKDSVEEIKINWPSQAPQVVQDIPDRVNSKDEDDELSNTPLSTITKPKKRRAPTRVERLAKKREEELREQQLDPMQKKIKELGQPIAARRDLEGSNPIHLHNIVFTDKDIEYVVVVYKKEIRNILLQYEMFFSNEECPYNQMPKTSPYIVIGNDVYELQSFTSINYQDRTIK